MFSFSNKEKTIDVRKYYPQVFRSPDSLLFEYKMSSSLDDSIHKLFYGFSSFDSINGKRYVRQFTYNDTLHIDAIDLYETNEEGLYWVKHMSYNYEKKYVLGNIRTRETNVWNQSLGKEMRTRLYVNNLKNEGDHFGFHERYTLIGKGDKVKWGSETYSSILFDYEFIYEAPSVTYEYVGKNIFIKGVGLYQSVIEVKGVVEFTRTLSRRYTKGEWETLMSKN